MTEIIFDLLGVNRLQKLVFTPEVSPSPFPHLVACPNHTFYLFSPFSAHEHRSPRFPFDRAWAPTKRRGATDATESASCWLWRRW